ncbi:MAG: peptidoglycan DD-metalloendopeptidase family protein [Desulfobacterales bacterium]|nr:peptidoglycan DD-metalloendopeptidase family protein [Desulfobacterales bacterium]
MLFQSPYKWWQNHNSLKNSKRKTLHEGLDILFFKDKNNHIQNLWAGMSIPTATDGKVVNICDDFLGQSIVVRHSISFQQKLDLIFIYAHLLTDIKIKIGSDLKQGDIIASIADVTEKKTTIPPHLHLSVIEIPKSTPAKNLNWNFFSDTKSKPNLINPLFL